MGRQQQIPTAESNPNSPTDAAGKILESTQQNSAINVAPQWMGRNVCCHPIPPTDQHSGYCSRSFPFLRAASITSIHQRFQKNRMRRLCCDTAQACPGHGGSRYRCDDAQKKAGPDRQEAAEIQAHLTPTRSPSGPLVCGFCRLES